MALGGQIVKFVGPHLLNDPDQVSRVGHITIMQKEPALFFVRILIEMVDPIGVEERGAPLDSVYHITFSEEKFGKVSSVLPGDACDQSNFFHDD